LHGFSKGKTLSDHLCLYTISWILQINLNFQLLFRSENLFVVQSFVINSNILVKNILFRMCVYGTIVFMVYSRVKLCK